MIKTNFRTIFPTAKWLSFVLLILVSFELSAQKQIPPRSNKLVNDYVGILSSGEVNALESKLVAYDDSTSTQIAIVIEQSLLGDDAFSYAHRLAQTWGIGQEGKNNGILIYVSKGDRKVQIVTGYGVEGFFTDAMSRRITENVIVPSFRQNDFYGGLNRSTDVIIQLGNGEYQQDDFGEEGFPFEALVFLIILIIIIVIIINNTDGHGGGYHKGGKYDSGRGGWVIFGPGGGGLNSGGGGGFGGGGFGGFGGGGFGGGGAGGGW